MNSVRYFIAVSMGMFVSWIARILRYGAGSTWPGEIALRIYPSLLTVLKKRVTKGIICVAGTNGKTTTSLMIAGILKSSGYTVLHNTSGANLVNGIVSSFFHSWKKTDFAVFEVDENSLPRLLRFIHPSVLVLMNLFRDQLDRYGEVDTIGSSWRSLLVTLSEETTIVANGDDPTIAAVTEKLHSRVVYIGLEDPTYYLPKMQHATDSIYCPKCGHRLTFGGVYFSHLGKWACGACGFTHPDILLTAASYTSPLEGVYNIYNTLAAAAASEVLHIDSGLIQKSLDTFQPAFGRMEEVVYKGVSIRILLSKNPTGFNESLRTVLASDKKGPMLIVLNDRTPDGTDVSWIWDVDFEQLKNYPFPLMISGDRTYDMAIRINYATDEKHTHIEHDDHLESAIENVVRLAKTDETLWILATYSAMLDVRKIITGKKIL
ncbi:MAG: Mur ligase family protein [Microgenomates group bacterium]